MFAHKDKYNFPYSDKKIKKNNHNLIKIYKILPNKCPNLKTFHHAQYYTYPRGTTYITEDGWIKLDISNCPALTEFESNFIGDLTIDNCPTLKTLTAIGVFENADFSGNTSIDSIYCHSFRLKTVDISACTSLKECYCLGAFETIDLSRNKDLEILRLNAKNLNNLNINTLTNLKELDLTSDNMSGTLDINKNKALKTIHLKNAPNNTNQQGDFQLYLSGLPSLKEIKCQFNTLTELIVSDCESVSSIFTGKYSLRQNITYYNKYKKLPHTSKGRSGTYGINKNRH